MHLQLGSADRTNGLNIASQVGGECVAYWHDNSVPAEPARLLAEAADGVCSPADLQAHRAPRCNPLASEPVPSKVLPAA